MILALVGHRFLIEERAKEELKRKGFLPRDVPWLGNSDEELTPVESLMGKACRLHGYPQAVMLLPNGQK